jgi:integrase/recombinase XerD
MALRTPPRYQVRKGTQIPREMKTTLEIHELLEHFRDDQDVMPSTRKVYYNVIRHFFSWCYHNDIDWQHIGISHIIRFKDQMFSDGKSARTIRMYLIVVKIFWKWLEQNGIDKNIAQGIRLPRRMYHFAKIPLTVEQLQAFMHSIDTSTPIGKRDYAMFVLFFTTGLRGVSVEAINIGDIKTLNGEKVLWYRNKGYRLKDKYKPLTDKCLEAINDYLLTRRYLKDDMPLFVTHASNRKNTRLSTQSMRLIFKNRLKAIGIDDKRITLHSTRHTYGVIALQTGGLYEAQVGLNHASSKTTRVYIHSEDEKIILKNTAGKAINALL